MKKYLAVGIVTLILVIMGINFYQTKSYKTQKVSTITSSETVQRKPVQPMIAVVNISGFDCPSCPVGAEYALKDTKGVLDAKVTTSGERSRILYDANMANISDLEKALDPFTIDKVISDQPSQKDTLD